MSVKVLLERRENADGSISYVNTSEVIVTAEEDGWVPLVAPAYSQLLVKAVMVDPGVILDGQTATVFLDLHVGQGDGLVIYIKPQNGETPP